MERVIGYIDGYNLYYGLKSKGWQRYYWLNLQSLIQNLLKPGQTLCYVKYFTTIIKHPSDRHKRQSTYLEALQTLPNFRIFYGHFLSDEVVCYNCGHRHITHHEKMTDVNIAVELMSDAYQDEFDTALLISADSDLVGPVRAVSRLFKDKRIVIGFPPNRVSSELKRYADGFFHIGKNEIAKSQFPDQIRKEKGYVLARPMEWR